MILSILIPTVIGRESSFNELEEFLQWQISQGSLYDEVEIITLCDNKEITIGEKRNKLYEMAKGTYAVQIDDDDWLHYQYIERVLMALESNPDCVGYKELCTYEGRSVKSSEISLKHKSWSDNKKPDSFNFFRSPFYKVPIKTEICKRVRFKDMRFGEDEDFSKRILTHLKTESYIDEFMYIYRYKSENPDYKYGFKRREAVHGR